MAKVNDIKKDLGGLKKKPIITEEQTKPIVETIHAKPEDQKSPPVKNAKKRGRRKTLEEETTRYTIDIPNSVYKALKHRLADEGGTMKSVVIRLLKKELGLK